MAPAKSPPSKMIRILCFGDSLTEGYWGGGCGFSPYNEKLQQMVEMAFPEYAVETTVDGESGDFVGVKPRGNFLKRMTEQFESYEEEGQEKYDWTIVLGGTNDLAVGTSPEMLFETLKTIWAIPLSHKRKVLALTIPESGPPGAEGCSVDTRRRKVNDLIKGYKHDNFYVYDLAAAVPYFSLSDADRERYWDDPVHMTTEGYELVGRKVGMALVSLLVKDKFKGQTPAKRKRNFPDDDGMFEEEGGDPNSLTAGYIVVRRKDLE